MKVTRRCVPFLCGIDLINKVKLKFQNLLQRQALQKGHRGKDISVGMHLDIGAAKRERLRDHKTIVKCRLQDTLDRRRRVLRVRMQHIAVRGARPTNRAV